MINYQRFIPGVVLFLLSGLVYFFQNDPWSSNPWPGIELLTNQFGYFCILVASSLALVAFIPTRWLFSKIGAFTAIIFNMPTRWFLAFSALTLLFLSGYISLNFFGGIPHVADSHAQYIQAKIFLDGHCALPKHPLYKQFYMQFMLNKNGQYYSMYPPGHSVLLAIGIAAGMPWLVNPTLGALFVVAIYFLAREMGTPRTGRIAVLLTLISPFYVFMSSSYMNHTTAILAFTLFVLFYIRMCKYALLRYGVFAGLAMGLLGVTRVQCAAWALGILLPHMGYLLLRDWRRYLKPLCMLGIAGAIFLSFYLYYNWCTTGNPLMTGYSMNKVRFKSGLPPGSSPIFWMKLLNELYVDLSRVGMQVVELHFNLWCWFIPSLSFALLLYVMGGQKPYSWIAVVLLLGTIIGLVFYNFVGIAFGPRYLYEVSAPLVVLSALAIQRIGAFARMKSKLRIKRRVWRGALFSVISGLVISGFWGETGYLIGLYSDDKYWEGNDRYYNYIENHVEKPAIVFISEYNEFLWVSFTLPPDPNAPVIYALRKFEDDNQKLREYYPGRHAYYLIEKKLIKVD